MKRTPYTTGYLTGLLPLTGHASAWLQPDGHYGLNNAGIFWSEEGAILVDCAWDVPRTRRIVEAIESSGAAAANIAALILTHDHGDHSFGACAVPTPRVIMTDAAAKALRHAAGALSVQISGLTGDARSMMETLLADKFDFTGVRYRPATETFSGNRTLIFGDLELRLHEYSGLHTVSDTVVFCPRERVVVMGDLLFADSHVPMFEPASRRWAAAMDDVLAMEADHYIAGHGRMCTREDVMEQRDYLLWLYDECERRFKAGMTSEEAADDLVSKLGAFAHLQRADNLVSSIPNIYCEISPEAPKIDYPESLARRWRFRIRWRGKLPGVADPLPLNTRLGGFKTLSELRMLEGT